MNDHELDELLDQWQSPAMRDSMREDLRTGFADTAKRAKRAALPRRIIGALPRIRLGRFAAATMGVAALLFALVQVSPQTVRMASPASFRIPYYVEFLFWRYSENGSTMHPTRITSFPYGGHEIVMSVKEPGHFLFVAARGIANSIRTQFILAVPSFVLPKEPPMAEPAWFAGFVSSGCSSGKTVVGHETLAGYKTTVVETAAGERRTRIWMAPDLACFALKLTDEVRDANGTYRLRIRKEAVKVTMNP